MQTPAPFEYERATSVDGVIEALGRLGPQARIVAGGHSLLPMMKLRLANPEHLIDINELSELSYIREQDGEIRIGALTRHAELLESELLARRLPAVRRRRAGDRRPGRPQPGHDRRLAVPGRRGRGPVRGLLGGEGAGRDPRRRGRAGGRDGGLPRRAVHDGRRCRARCSPRCDCRCAPARAAHTRRSSAGPAIGRSPRPRPRSGSTAVASPTSASRSARSGSRRSTSPAPRSSCAASRPRTSSSRRRARSPPPTARPTADGRGPVDYKRHLAGVLTQRALRRATARALNQEA